MTLRHLQKHLASLARTTRKSKVHSTDLTNQDKSLRKATTVLKKYGYKYDNKRITAINSDDSGDTKTVKTPKKTPAKSTKAGSTPAQKKRKLEVMEDSGEEDGEATGAGEGSDVEAADEDEDG